MRWRYKPAHNLWGKTTHETEDLIRAQIENKYIAKELRVASIGPAGEKLSRIACVINDKNRAAGRSGVGAVMGSKEFESDCGRVPAGLCWPIKKVFKKRFGIPEHIQCRIANLGIIADIERLPGLRQYINQAHLFPTKNWQEDVL